MRGTRPVLVTFENFKDRDEVLRKVSEQFPSKIDERAASKNNKRTASKGKQTIGHKHRPQPTAKEHQINRFTTLNPRPALTGHFLFLSMPNTLNFKGTSQKEGLGAANDAKFLPSAQREGGDPPSLTPFNRGL